MKAITKFTEGIEPIREDRQLVTVTDRPLDQHPAAVYVASLTSGHSRRNMLRYLNQIAGLLTGREVGAFEIEWGATRYAHTAAIRSKLIETYAPATVNVMLSALRGVLREAWKLGQISAEDYQRSREVKNVKGETIPAGRELGDGEILALVSACKADMTAAGARDAALIGLLYAGGLRRAEIVALDFADFDQQTGRLLIRHGKGRKERTLYVDNGALHALAAWLAFRGIEAGAMFQPVNKGGTIQPVSMTSQAVYNMLKKRAAEAKVKDFSPHDFRRTLAGILIERADIVTAQHILGHASVNTTARYDRRPEETKRKAAKLVHFPF